MINGIPLETRQLITDNLKIAASSVTPLTGRLAEIFTPRLYVIFASAIFSIGLFISAAAPTLTIFLLGRAVAGIGSGGLMSIAIILVVDLASPKRRGLCIGMINAGYTTGLASGAVLAGLMTSSLGWVCRTMLSLEVRQID
jgi:MFS family permease